MSTMRDDEARGAWSKSHNFPVKFPVSREMERESGSHQTARTASESAVVYFAELTLQNPGLRAAIRRKSSTREFLLHSKSGPRRGLFSDPIIDGPVFAIRHVAFDCATLPNKWNHKHIESRYRSPALSQ